MGAQELGVSGAFRDLADVLESFETSETDLTVTSATPVGGNLVENQDVSVEVGVQVPFLNGGVEEDKTAVVTANDAYVQDDGSLHLELQVTAGDAVESELQSPEPEAKNSNQSSKSEPDTAGPSQTPTDDATRPKTDVTTDRSSGSKEGTNEGSKEGTNEEETDETQSESPEPEPPDGSPEVNEDESVSTETDESQPSDGTDDSQQPSDDDQQPPSGDADDTQPVYRDRKRLQEVYERNDTFTEMTDALGVDVTPQTVRRYMIKYDIHEPASNTCSSSINTLLEADPDSLPLGDNDPDGDDEGEDAVPDLESPESVSPNGGDPTGTPPSYNGESYEEAIQNGDIGENKGLEDEDIEKDEISENESSTKEGASRESDDSDSGSNPSSEQEYCDLVEPEGVELPDHLTLDDIKKTVRNAKTLYEAQREFELDRDQTRELLRELNLLDLVQSRLSNREHQDRTLEEINNRIHTKAQSEGA